MKRWHQWCALATGCDITTAKITDNSNAGQFSQQGMIADLQGVAAFWSMANGLAMIADGETDGHADRFWALALALHAASNPCAPIEFMSSGRRAVIAEMEGFA